MNMVAIRSLVIFCTLLCGLGFGNNLLASEPEQTSHTAEEETHEFDPGQMIIHHIKDSHEWEFARGAVLPLPVIVWNSHKGGLDVFMSNKIDWHHGHDQETGHTEGEEHLPDHKQEAEFDPDPHAYMGYTVSNDGKLIYEVNPGEYTREGIIDLSITKNVASMLISALLLILTFTAVARGFKKNKGKAPAGIQSFFEPIIVFIRDDIAKPNIGHKYERFMPYLLTVFFFIWFNNLLGLLPGAANVTGNIAVTMVLALFTLLITLFNGNKHYWQHIFNTPGVPLFLKVIPIMPLVEFIGIFTKPFSLMLRLFANITAGHIIILSLLSLIFIFQSYAMGVVSSLFATAMNMLELFVAILQAYVFTLLSALYFGDAVQEHHGDEVHGEEQHIPG